MPVSASPKQSERTCSGNTVSAAAFPKIVAWAPGATRLPRATRTMWGLYGPPHDGGDRGPRWVDGYASSMRLPLGPGPDGAPPLPPPDPRAPPPAWLLPRPLPGAPPPPRPPPHASIPPPHLLTWDNLVPWPFPSARDDRPATTSLDDAGGLLLWHRDRDGLPGDGDDDEPRDGDGDWDGDDSGMTEGYRFELDEAWLERFAKTEVTRRERERERRREARRRERPKVPAAAAAEAKVAAILAARRAEERGEGSAPSAPSASDPVRLYGEEGAAVILALEAKLNARYDDLLDRRAPPTWPCEPLNPSAAFA